MAEYLEYQWNLSNSTVETDLAPKEKILTKTQALAAMRDLIPSRPDVGL